MSSMAARSSDESAAACTSSHEQDVAALTAVASSSRTCCASSAVGAAPAPAAPAPAPAARPAVAPSSSSTPSGFTNSPTLPSDESYQRSAARRSAASDADKVAAPSTPPPAGDCTNRVRRSPNSSRRAAPVGRNTDSATATISITSSCTAAATRASTSGPAGRASRRRNAHRRVVRPSFAPMPISLGWMPARARRYKLTRSTRSRFGTIVTVVVAASTLGNEGNVWCPTQRI